MLLKSTAKNVKGKDGKGKGVGTFNVRLEKQCYPSKKLQCN